LEKSYSLQPWRSTLPLASYVGSSTLPSTVDLYLNGLKQYSQQVPAGPYELVLPPGISGAHMARVVATDILGRTTVVDMPLYGGSYMLARGLNEWSVEAGYIRTGFGEKSFAYHREPVVSGTLRYGLSNWLTGQVHAEAARNYQQWGVGANLLVGPLGQLNATAAQSRLHGVSGRRMDASFTTRIKGVSLGVGHSETDARFASLDRILPSAPPIAQGERLRTSTASMGFGSNTWGNWSLGYIRFQRGTQAAESTASLNWSKALSRRLQLHVGATQGFSGPRQRSLYASVSLNLDNRISSSVTAQHATGGSGPASTSYLAELRRPGQGLESWGWHLSAQAQGQSGSRMQSQYTAGVDYNNQYGEGWATLQSSPWNSYHAQASWRGGLVLAQGGLFASKSIYDSFAVVDTDGIPHVPVRSQNNPVGQTNQQGLLLVPNLASYQKNSIHIDTRQLPANLLVERSQAEVVPSEKSGMMVRFGLRKVRSVMFTAVNTAGETLPPGSTIINASGTPVAVTGFDGKVYLDDVPPGTTTLRIHSANGQAPCTVTVHMADEPASTEWVPDLGSQTCKN
ncbi:MAG: fimbria/pilus outer membrane usher protein, partial [Brachymonas sp.]|nr:fimbria/pilus outer membrane usher protein [Brachymonas sp.]